MQHATVRSHLYSQPLGPLRIGPANHASPKPQEHSNLFLRWPRRFAVAPSNHTLLRLLAMLRKHGNLLPKLMRPTGSLCHQYSEEKEVRDLRLADLS